MARAHVLVPETVGVIIIAEVAAQGVKADEIMDKRLWTKVFKVALDTVVSTTGDHWCYNSQKHFTLCASDTLKITRFVMVCMSDTHLSSVALQDEPACVGRRGGSYALTAVAFM